MQICDCVDYLDRVFEVDNEIIGYRNTDELIDLLQYYLDHDQERQKIAQRGFRRTVSEYRFQKITRRAGKLINAEYPGNFISCLRKKNSENKV